MSFYDFVVTNREIVKIVYAAIILFICILIVNKSDKLFRISSHNGIRYFRNAFFFFGWGFFIRYFVALFFNQKDISPYSFVVDPIFEFFLIMGGFFLLYSLMWRRFEANLEYKSSLINPRIFFFYILAIVIVLLDFLWSSQNFMFFSQIIVFSLASIITSLNYKKKNNKFSIFYLVAMLLALFAWSLNTLASSFFKWNPAVLIYIYAFNAIFFLLFLYGVVKVTNKNG